MRFLNQRRRWFGSFSFSTDAADKQVQESAREYSVSDNSSNQVDASHLLRLRDAAILTTTAIAGFLWIGRELPVVPWATPDTESYLQFSPIRPHGYSWLLAAYRCAFKDL